MSYLKTFRVDIVTEDFERSKRVRVDALDSTRAGLLATFEAGPGPWKVVAVAEVATCERCDAELIAAEAVWLELNCHKGTWHTAEDEVPENESQGCFPFGADCAKHMLAGEA